MAEQTYVVKNFNELTTAQRVRALQLPDFLERKITGSADRLDDLYQSGYVAYGANDETPVGRITVFRRNLLSYRDPGTGIGKLLSAGLIEFPVTSFLEPELWDALFGAAFTELFEIGTGVAGVYLPPECSAHIEYLTNLGFERHADSDRPVPTGTDAFPTAPSLYLRHCPLDRGHSRPNAYPISASINLMRTANAAMALKPENDAWAAVLNYSGYSGYPWLTPLLDRLLDSPKRLLSIPAGTGDTIRLLPERILAGIDTCVGIDILDRNIGFAKARHRDPSIDVLNMVVAGAFLEAKVSNDAEPVLRLLDDICARAGRPITYAEAVELYVELRAVTEEALTCGGIADWFALTKGIGRFVDVSPRPGLFHARHEENRELDYCVSLVEAISADGVLAIAESHPGDHRFANPGVLDTLREKAARGDISFEAADMFAYRADRPFDTVFIWEAALIIARAGRQEDFVDMIDANLTPGGTLVMTGIRREDGRSGRDLEIVHDVFRSRGYSTVLTQASPPSERWARGHLTQPVFPVMIATKRP